MSSTPVSTGDFSMVSMSLAMRWARGTPRRLMPMRPRLALPLLLLDDLVREPDQGALDLGGGHEAALLAEVVAWRRTEWLRRNW